MNNILFQGVCTALATPFKNDKLNLPMLEKLMEKQMEAGIRAFVICGTTGEAPTLSSCEKITLYREARKIAGKDAVILAGSGSNNTQNAVYLSKAAENQGADGLLVVTPYYNKCTEAGLIQHYEKIAEAVSIPIILYNVPSRTGVDISPGACLKLSKIPGVIGIKEASSDLRKAAKIIRICPESFSVYSGNDDLLLPMLSIGSKGVISVASNIKPGEMKSVTDAFFSGNFEQARQKFLSLLPLIDSLFSEVNPIPIKAALAASGLDCGKCRLPLTEISPAHLESIKKLL